MLALSFIGFMHILQKSRKVSGALARRPSAVSLRSLRSLRETPTHSFLLLRKMGGNRAPHTITAKISGGAVVRRLMLQKIHERESATARSVFDKNGVNTAAMC